MTPERTPVLFLGAGPGDPELITVKGTRALAAAQVVVWAGSLVNADLLSLAPRATLFNSASMTLEETTQACVQAYEEGLRVVRLHSGDPSLFGAIGEQMDELSKRDIPFEIIPGVSSFAAGAAALKTELTAPEIAQTLILTRMAGRTPMPRGEELEKLAGHGQATLCLFLSVLLIDKAVKALLTHYRPDTPAAVVYKASWPDQQIIEGTLADIAQKTRQAKIVKQALIYVGPALTARHTRSHLYSKEFSHSYRRSKKSSM